MIYSTKSDQYWSFWCQGRSNHHDQEFLGGYGAERPAYVTFLKTGWWNSNDRTSEIHKCLHPNQKVVFRWSTRSSKYLNLKRNTLYIQRRPTNFTQKFIKQSLVAIILALFVVKSSRVDSFKDTSFICGGGLLGLQEFKPQLFTMIIYPNPVGIMNYQLWTFQIQLLNLFCPS